MNGSLVMYFDFSTTFETSPAHLEKYFLLLSSVVMVSANFITCSHSLKIEIYVSTRWTDPFKVLAFIFGPLSATLYTCKL